MPEVQSWRFTALEFRTLWESTGRDVLPYPLQHQYTTEFRSESLRLRQAAAQELRPRIDDDLLRAVEVLLAPEARVEVAGFAGARRDRRLRAHAGVHYQHGAIAVQAPGSEPEHGGDVVLTLLPAGDVARAVVDVFPACAPGRGKQLRASAEELERPRPPVRDAWRPTPREEFERFFTRAMTLIGHVGVYAMGSVDNRHINGRKDFQLNDVENDGRYVTFGTDVVTIKPTTADRIAATLQQMMARTVTEVRDGVHLPY
ncbi:ESX secretion-associated protein EspG [Nocardia abscessus]|uniref:ESX secretion-associated protein EspG n=1 Tax=Nocardia TaxID=1817 RepID=UPI0018938731|nr:MULTISPECIES: ESX secretion-associated protein EspG [Nocardia]MBF6218246.1 ESX secretion-associated protein EspG [Nocardia abscessus]MDE1670387.1 ESX secretion-associated protein EspG [Nocardia gipuzkoensis]